MNKKISKWFTFAALLMFVGATFQITGDHFILGAICFVAAASFAYTANEYRKKENTMIYDDEMVVSSNL